MTCGLCQPNHSLRGSFFYNILAHPPFTENDCNPANHGSDIPDKI